MNPSLHPTRAPRNCLSKYSRVKLSKTLTAPSQAQNPAASSRVPQYQCSLQYSDLNLEEYNDFAIKIDACSPIDSNDSGRKSTIGSESDAKSWSQDLEVRDSPNAYLWRNNDIFFEKGNGISINIEELKAFGSPQIRNLEASELDEISIIEEEAFGEDVEIVIAHEENFSEKEENEEANDYIEDQEEEKEDYYEEQKIENICQDIEQVIQSSVEEPFLLRGFSFVKGNSKTINEQQDASLYNFTPNFGFFGDTIYSRKSEFEEDNEPKEFNFDDSDIDIDCDRVLKKIKTEWSSFK